MGVTIARVDVRRVAWRGARTFASARGRWSAREACWLRLEDEDGVVGIGEAAPLPGWSAESAGACEDAIVSRVRVGAAIAIEPTTVRASIDAIANALDAWPAARLAVETACLDLVARRRSTTLANVVAREWDLGEAARRVPLAAVVTADDPRDWAREIARVVERGVRHVKVKIGKYPWDVEKTALTDAWKPVAGRAELRLDANGAWSSCEATELAARLDALAAVGARWIEEPIRLAQADSRMLEVLARAELGVAADESLVGPAFLGGLACHLGARVVRAVVIKPTPVGGITRSVDIARAARHRGAPAVLSHALEGPIAHATFAELALALGGTEAVGLDRHALLAAWPERCVPQLGANAIEAQEHAGHGVTWDDALAGASS